MGERTKPSPLLTTQVTEEMANIFKKAAENLGYSFKSITEGEMITKNLKVSKGYEFVTIGTSTPQEREEIREEVLKLEEEVSENTS